MQKISNFSLNRNTQLNKKSYNETGFFLSFMASLNEIENSFIRRLKEFAANGYIFYSGCSLRRGTRQDPNAQGTQREAFDAFTKGFEEGHRHGYFEIPTGVGKTAIFISFIKNYIDAASKENGGSQILIVVPSEKLAVQTAQAFAKFMPELAPTIETDDNTGKEIDWENSHVGLQYGKAKHAERKPRVLITTYQSLIRDREDKTYPPKDYGMVIYDEGHAITAGQYGLAVDKFKNSIQLAVSATPEYSTEKTVATRLPFRYYQLPIADAINRGDLCNVRPVLLKTDFKIDKKKFETYLKQNYGRPLNDKQITALLNEQTRNRAAMETYLLCGDPDSGERYLGQNGMIFCGNTIHVDDFVRQFNELLRKPTYQPVSQWLDTEDIELIAPVHGKIKGAFLKKGMLIAANGQVVSQGRRYEGNKEWYSEEEIFDLHAKGKILLLASVKKLKEGYDSPRDSIVIDTVDRLSKVDATQIVGRGFRLNPENPEFNDPGNPDKTCTVINMVDKNTHELYADKPQMLPIYCAEIIEGAQFRVPARRKHLIQRFTKQPPELNTSLEASGFELETNIEHVRDISQKNKKARDDAQPIDKPKGYWGYADFQDRMGVSPQMMLDSFKTQFADPTRKFLTHRKLEIPRDAFATYTSKGKSAIAIKEEWGRRIIRLYKTVKGKNDDIFSALDLADEMRIGVKAAEDLVTGIRIQVVDMKQPHAQILGLKIPSNKLIKYRNSVGQDAWGIEALWAKKLIAAHKLRFPKKTDDETNEILSSTEFAPMMGISIPTALKYLTSWKDALKNADKIDWYSIEIPKEALIEYAPKKGATTWGIKREYAERIALEYKALGTSHPDFFYPGGRLKPRPIIPFKSPAHQTEEERDVNKHGGQVPPDPPSTPSANVANPQVQPDANEKRL